jgi:hypothetical protein
MRPRESALLPSGGLRPRVGTFSTAAGTPHGAARSIRSESRRNPTMMTKLLRNFFVGLLLAAAPLAIGCGTLSETSNFLDEVAEELDDAADDLDDAGDDYDDLEDDFDDFFGGDDDD